MFYHDPLTHYAVNKFYGSVDGYEVIITALQQAIVEKKAAKKNIPDSFRTQHEMLDKQIANLELSLSTFKTARGKFDDEKRREEQAKESGIQQPDLSSKAKAEEELAAAQVAAEELLDQIKKESPKSMLIPNRTVNPVISASFALLSATAMAVSYSRNQSLLKSFGAGLISVPYLIYVAIDSRKE